MLVRARENGLRQPRGATGRGIAGGASRTISRFPTVRGRPRQCRNRLRHGWCLARGRPETGHARGVAQGLGVTGVTIATPDAADRKGKAPGMMDLWRDFRGGLAEMRPSRFPYAKFAAALILGIAGGWLFAWLMLPLPWMLGPMTVCTLAALMKLPIAAPTVVRPPMSAVIGVMLGAAFSPDIAARLLGWLPTVIGLAFFVAASGIACVWYFRKVGRMISPPPISPACPRPGRDGDRWRAARRRRAHDRARALGTHPPGGDDSTVSRPGRWRESRSGSGPAPRRRSSMRRFPPSSGSSPVSLRGRWWGMCCACRRNTCSGRCSFSALVHFSGLTDFKPPTEIVQRRAGRSRCGPLAAVSSATAPKLIMRILVLTAGSTMILLGMTLVFALVVAQFSNYGVVPPASCLFPRRSRRDEPCRDRRSYRGRLRCRASHHPKSSS